MAPLAAGCGRQRSAEAGVAAEDRRRSRDRRRRVGPSPRTTAPGPRDDRTTVALELDAGRLRGSVGYVPDAHGADVLLIEVGGSLRAGAARTRPASRIEALRTVDDTRRVGELVFDGVAALERRAAAGGRARRQRRGGRASAPGRPHRARRRRARCGARRPAHRRRVRQAARAVRSGDRLVPGGQAHVRRDRGGARSHPVAALVHRLRLGSAPRRGAPPGAAAQGPRRRDRDRRGHHLHPGLRRHRLHLGVRHAPLLQAGRLRPPGAGISRRRVRAGCCVATPGGRGAVLGDRARADDGPSI